MCVNAIGNLYMFLRGSSLLSSSSLVVVIQIPRSDASAWMVLLLIMSTHTRAHTSKHASTYQLVLVSTK